MQISSTLMFFCLLFIYKTNHSFTLKNSFYNILSEIVALIIFTDKSSHDMKFERENSNFSFQT